MSKRTLSPRELYFQWVNSTRLSSTDLKKLKILTPEEQEREFTLSGNEFQFGTSGIRALTGIGPKRLNVHTFRVFAEAYSVFLKKNPSKKPILIGYDNREHGRLFAETMYKVLEHNSVPALLSAESIATPILAFYIKEKKLKGGVMITASHNPQCYNGFKLYGSNGGQLSAQEEAEIRKNFLPPEDYLTVKYSNSSKFEALGNESFEQYILALTREIKKRLGKFFVLGGTVIRTIKFLFSSHHGTSSGRMTTLARSFGAQRFKEYYWECTPTSDFSDEEITNPEEPKSFRNMSKEARTLEIDYLIAHDPDSDRSALAEWIGDKWYYFTGNEMAVLLAYFLLEMAQSEKEARIQYKYLITTYVSGDFIDKVVKLFQSDFPIEVIRTNTGFKSIGKKVEECSAKGEVLLGCEEAIGGLFLPNISLEKDGFQQTILTMYMIAFYKFGGNKKLMETEGRNLVSQLYWLMWRVSLVWLGRTISFKITMEERKHILGKLNELAEQEQVVQLDRFQLKVTKGEVKGLFKFSFPSSPDNWVKARFSGTEPKFKLYFNLYSEIEEREANSSWKGIVREKRAKLDYTIQLLTKLLEGYLFS
ncbi:phosphoglucomutase [Mycoplasma wenyonii]|uniref:phosphoglucomutase n=1 Tax=Mycoplasma wenyonii TaxID=65123 RepID=UPI0011D1F59F|nr:phosphoglucomutase [Mycoplasma wenyonii]